MYQQKHKKIITTALTAAFMAGIMSCSAFAATKTMTRVTVRVGAEATSYENTSINCDIWDSLDAQEGNFAAVDSEKYSVRTAEWVDMDADGLKIGDQPVMKIYLQMGHDEFRFAGSYSSKTALVKNGTLISAEKTNDELVLTVRLNPIEGQYAAPDWASWTTGGYGNRVAQWGFHSTNLLTSGAYDVYLYRDNIVVKKLEAYQGTYYDFYPYMVKPGNYYVKLRTVPYTEAERTHGRKSEWIESGSSGITEEDKSDGSGKGEWLFTNGIWQFRHPDQSLQTDGWLMVNTRWYLFDASATMLTGFQVKDGQTYYLDTSGAMATGWTQLGDAWYYFYPDSGCMATDTTVDGYQIGTDGIWR